MDNERPSDTITYNLSAMRHAHEAIVVALKAGKYDGEKIESKELDKLPQVDYRICRAIEIGELLDKVVGNAPYRAYGVLATSYKLLCLNLHQRISEIDQDKKPSEYLSPKQLIPPKDIDIKSVEKCKVTLGKWLADKNLKHYVKPYEEDIDRLNKLVNYCDNQFKNQKNYPGDKLVFSPFPDSVLYYANQLFQDCLNKIMEADDDKARKAVEVDGKPAGKIMTKTCGMDDILCDFERTYGLLTELLNGAMYDNKELTKSQTDRLKEIDSYYRQIIDISKSFVVLFDYLNFYQGHFGERRYARTWLKSGLNVVYDELTRIFYQTLDNKHFKNWTGCRKLKTPDIALGNTAVSLKDIASWLNDEKAMKTLQDYEYDMEQSLSLKNIEQRLINGQNEEYLAIVKPFRDSLNEFINITHYNCREALKNSVITA